MQIGSQGCKSRVLLRGRCGGGREVGRAGNGKAEELRPELKCLGTGLPWGEPVGGRRASPQAERRACDRDREGCGLDQHDVGIQEVSQGGRCLGCGEAVGSADEDRTEGRIWQWSSLPQQGHRVMSIPRRTRIQSAADWGGSSAGFDRAPSSWRQCVKSGPLTQLASKP